MGNVLGFSSSLRYNVEKIARAGASVCRLKANQSES